jgi:hypothetical protein
MKTLNRTILSALFTLIVSNALAVAKTKPPAIYTVIADTTVKSAPVKSKPDTTGFAKYFNKSFVLQKDLRVMECDAVGIKLASGSNPIAPQGITFTVKGVAPNGSLIISFWIWGLKASGQQNTGSVTAETLTNTKTTPQSENNKDIFEQRDRIVKRQTFNFKQYADEKFAPSSIDSVNDNRRYFLLGADTLVKSAVEYQATQKWNINFGTLVTPFKLRFNRFGFSNNLSVGGAIYYQHTFKKDWSWGTILALSLSSVTLDATSTNISPALTSSTTRPAFSPSLHGVISYKNINFTLGIGFDYLSKPSDIASATNPEAGWIYNGKPWLGIGIGFSLFSNSSTATPANTPGQTPAQ